MDTVKIGLDSADVGFDAPHRPFDVCLASHSGRYQGRERVGPEADGDERKDDLGSLVHSDGSSSNSKTETLLPVALRVLG